MGTLRLFLALTVMVFHLGVPIWGLNYGVSSVVVFFIISGYAIAGLIRSHYKKLKFMPAFFADRMLRLYPQFFMYFISYIVIGRAFNITDAYFHLDCSAFGYAINLAIIPLDYWEFFANETFKRCMVISQSWTVGLELQIYVALAAVLLGGHLRKFFVASFFLFIIGLFNYFSCKWFIYVSVPPTFFIFICGSLILSAKKPDFLIVVTCWVFCVFGLIVIYFFPMHTVFLAAEILLGIVLGLPALLYVSKLRPSALDGTLGSMSYGVYLNHMIVILAVRKFSTFAQGGFLEASIAILIACLAAWLSYRFVEFPVTIWRRRRRSSAIEVTLAPIREPTTYTGR